MKVKISIFSLVLSLMGFLALPTPVNARVQEVALGEGVTMTAEVIGIDRADRSLDLMTSSGDVVSVEISDAAYNFDQIKIGDKVTVKYFESIALYLGKKGEKAQKSADLVAARSPKGDMPAGVVVEAVDVSATVKSINKKKRILILELADGSTVSTKVDKSVKAFDTLKKGDAIHARYTEAVAVSVTRP